MAKDNLEGVKIVGEVAYEKTPLTIFGQIFRALFYVALLFIVWRFLPFSFDNVDFKGITTMIGTLLLTLSIVYGLFSPDPDEYKTWGTFGILFFIGVAALYGVSFLF